MRASTVCGVGSTMSRRRLWVRISNCSRLFLSTCGERLTVNFSMRVGSGMGPRTCAPVRFAVFTISRVDESKIRWSNALRRMRIFWPFIAFVSLFRHGRVCPGYPRLKRKSWMPGTRPGMTTDRLLLDDACDDAGTDGAAAFTDRETQLFFHRDRHDQVHFHRDVVARHHHLGAFGQMHDTGHVGGAEVELRPVVGEERGVTAALFLGQDVSLGLELGVRLDRTRLAQHLTALDFLALGTAQQRADVIAGLALIEKLAEHFDAGDDGLLGIAKANDLDFLADLDDAALDAAGDDGAAARDREHVFDRHHERLVDVALPQRGVAGERIP